MQTGVVFLRIVSPFYFVAAVKLVADGVLRGAERMRQFMASTFTDLILRVILAFFFSGLLQETGIWLSWPVGWSIAAAMSWIFCRKVLNRVRSTSHTGECRKTGILRTKRNGGVYENRNGV